MDYQEEPRFGQIQLTGSDFTYPFKDSLNRFIPLRNNSGLPVVVNFPSSMI